MLVSVPRVLYRVLVHAILEKNTRARLLLAITHGLWYNADMLGDLVRSDARLPAGVDPRALDTSLSLYVGQAESAIRHVEALSKAIEASLGNMMVPDRPTLDEADTITNIHERATRSALNAVKALNEVARLRSFLAGGPDSRPDLTVRGEIELRAIVLGAIKDLGWKVVEAP